MTQERQKLVELKNVTLTFNQGKSNEVKAIDNVSFEIYEGEIFGLVGESGSGKTMTALAIAGLLMRKDVKKKGEILWQLQYRLKTVKL